MRNLKDIVEEVQQTPSPRCWDAIASQLPAAGAAAGASAATAGKAAFGAGKIAAIIASSAAAITISAVAITKLNSTETPSAPTDTNPTEIAAPNFADSLDFQDTLLVEKDINAKENIVAEATKISPALLDENTPSKTESATTTTHATPISTPAVSTLPNTASSTHSNNSSFAATATQYSTPKSSEKTENAEQESQKNTAKTQEPLNSKQNQQENENGDFDDFSHDKPIKIEIPNIFTPNGDGVNDLFVINGIEFCENPALIVKNQQGKIVFQSRHYENNWDANGMPNGTYYYQFIYNINHTQQLRTGTLMIRR